MTKSERIGLWLLVFFCLAVPTFLAVQTILSANRAADQSAHEALAYEIMLSLAAVPPGQSYPDSLSELPLTYPDGGDQSLLARFKYESDGASCTVRTTVRDETIERRFPLKEGEQPR
jgi:hypothetical protein